MTDISQELEKIDTREAQLLYDRQGTYTNSRYGLNCGTISSPINEKYLTCDDDNYVKCQPGESYYDNLTCTISKSTQKLRVRTKEAFKLKTQSTSNLLLASKPIFAQIQKAPTKVHYRWLPTSASQGTHFCGLRNFQPKSQEQIQKPNLPPAKNQDLCQIIENPMVTAGQKCIKK